MVERLKMNQIPRIECIPDVTELISNMDTKLKINDDLPIDTVTTTKTLPDIINDLVPILERRIQQFHEMFDLPLLAEYWEEVLHRSIKDLGYETTWTPTRSHGIGEDLSIIGINNSRISCKSGVLNTPRGGKESVKWSGSRSTSFDTLKEKIEHLSGDHDDYYFCLAKKMPFVKRYKLLVFPSSVCKVDQLQWEESSSGKQWMGVGSFTSSIGKSMSAQLWTTLPLDSILIQKDIVIPVRIEERIKTLEDTVEKLIARIQDNEE